MSLFYDKFKISKAELNKYKQVLDDYSNNMTDENKLITAQIDDAITHRSSYDELYTDITNAIQGNVLDAKTSDFFYIKINNFDAMAIMNNKASIFDVSAINVELKTSKVDNEQFISVFNRILNESYLTKSNFKFTISDAIKYSRGYPMSITLIGWDDNAMLGNDSDFKGDITCENIPLTDFYWDPTSNDINTCEYCFITKTLPYYKIEQFLSQLKKSNLDLFNAFYISYNSKEVINEGSSVLADNSVLVNNGAVQLITLYKKVFNKDKTTINVYHIVGRKYIVGTQSYDISYLPFAILKESCVPDSFTGISSIMLALPYLKQKAFLDNICASISLTQKDPQYIVSQASGISGDKLIDYTNSQCGKVHMTSSDNPNNVVSLLPTPQVSQDMILWRQTLDNDISKIVGSIDVSSFNSKLSGNAVQNVLNQITIQENNSVIELEKYLVRFVSIILEFLRVKLSAKSSYKSELTFRSKSTKDIEDTLNKGYERVSLTPDEFENLYADVYIDASLLRTSKQQKQQQDLMQLFQFQAQYLGSKDIITFKDIVNVLNIPQKQAIIDRYEQQSDAVKLQKSTQLVQGVLQLMKDPNANALSLQEATTIVLNALEGSSQKQGGTN